MIVAAALVLVGALVAGPAAAERTPREDLTRAEDYFLVADFGTALRKVDDLLDAGVLVGDDLRAAWVLRGRCQVARGERGSAEDAFCEALGIDPRWRPDPALFTTGELEAFGRAVASCGDGAPAPGGGVPGGTALSGAPVAGSAMGRSAGSAPSYLPPPAGAPSGGGTPWYRKKLVLGVVGGAAAAAAVLALSGGGGGGEGAVDLPGFPELPSR